MVTFIEDPFQLLAFLHADLHSSMLRQNMINHIVGNMDHVLFFDNLLEMRGAERILLMSSKDDCRGLM